MLLPVRKGQVSAQYPTRIYMQPVHLQWAYWCPIIVFLGSMCFHATLTYVGQLLDEIPMIYGIVYFNYALDLHEGKADEANRIRKKWIGIGVALWVTFLMIALRHSPLPLQLSYGSMVILLTIRSILLARKLSVPLTTKLYTMAFWTYLSGFIMWLIERGYCSYTKPFHFHSWWHVLAGAGTYYWIQGTSALDAHVHSEKSRERLLAYHVHFVEFDDLEKNTKSNKQHDR
eukprot:TRINITY_DN11259_c0_g1_i1.p1 TRINITY_DN11259_c0_g1~~TRINITY_DN11259_c0_g1_i1.p1  ORF type:complete len:230 (-),score=44.87 TRINITY_DN11259_c0_g1_i1:79-768(-)